MEVQSEKSADIQNQVSIRMYMPEQTGLFWTQPSSIGSCNFVYTYTEWNTPIPIYITFSFPKFSFQI